MSIPRRSSPLASSKICRADGKPQGRGALCLVSDPVQEIHITLIQPTGTKASQKQYHSDPRDSLRFVSLYNAIIDQFPF